MATDVDQAIKWNGDVYPYVAPAELDIDDSLELHTEADEAVDPVTYEVLRHALWNVNVEHGESIIRTSGSPICAYGHDFNPAILDEEGGYVFFGKYNLYLAVSSATAVKWTLEYRSQNPGIHEGDMFLTNDPWIGTTHQPDVVIACPIFVEGKLFCWVSNTLHQWDLGGTAPGGFNPMAVDVFWEVPCYPPIKIIEGGEIRRDVEELYTRNSRLPELVALDLRSQVTGCNVARERILRLVERYGAATVKATMRKVQSDSAAAFARRVQTIPDGTWSEEGWMEVKLPGDRGLYKNRVELTKTRRQADLLQPRVGPAGRRVERLPIRLEGRGHLDVGLDDAVRPDVRPGRGDAEHRVRCRTGDDQLRHAAGCRVGRPTHDAAALDRHGRTGDLEDALHLRGRAPEGGGHELHGRARLPGERDLGTRSARSRVRVVPQRSGRGGAGRAAVARRSGHRRLALGPAVHDSQRRGQRAVLSGDLPVAPRGAQLRRHRQVPGRERLRGRDPLAQDRPRELEHGRSGGGGSRAGPVRRLPDLDQRLPADQGRRRAWIPGAHRPDAQRPRAARRRDRLGAGPLV